MTKYIFVTGGVVSGLGKGITAASLGRLLKARGLKVAAQKLDPYINVDPGTMSPYQHGEVYVTEDGAETDLDLGHYERFIDEDLNQYSNLTTGKVYSNVIQRERQGGYLGSTVQTIPHITDEIKTFIYQVGKKTDADVVITEIGGTIGDIESQPFIEAIRQVGLEVGRENALYVHVTLVPYLKASGEHKSKPTQHSVKELQGMGIIPNIIVLRADEPITDGSVFAKIAHFCNVKPDCVIENRTLPNLYEAPLMLEEANLSGIACRELGIRAPEPDLTEWRALVERIHHQSKAVRIGLVGKYVQLHDAYLSVAEALRHAGYALDAKVEIEWIDSETLTAENYVEILSGASSEARLSLQAQPEGQDAGETRGPQERARGAIDGLIVPGGFGSRGIEGMILAAQYAREHHVPYFGICLGMQIAVIEYARHVAGLENATSHEFDGNSPQKAPGEAHPEGQDAGEARGPQKQARGADWVIHYLPDQNDDIDKGGTLRLGKYPCVLRPGTAIAACYGTAEISERHRHRYEFNNAYRDVLQAAGLTLSGLSPDGRLVETVEISGERFFVGVQFHPEFKSRPNKPHPLFVGFVRASIESNFNVLAK